MHVWQHAEDYPAPADDMGPLWGRFCPVCGGYLDWVSCYSCFGQGEFDLYDEDPMWHPEGSRQGDTERCDVCKGEGGYFECVNLPHEGSI